MAEVKVDTKVLEGMVDFVEQSVGYAQKQAEVEAAVEERGPQVVDALIKSGFVNSDNREAALKAAKDPLKVLESLEKTAKAKTRKQASEAPDALGSADEIKEAGQTEEKAGESPQMAAANNRLLRSLGF